MLQENADLHIPTGAGPLTSRGDLMSKEVLEFSIWQESPSLAFLFLKESGTFPLSITRYSCNCDQKTLPFELLSDILPQQLRGGPASQPGSLHPCGEGGWAGPHPLQRKGCTNEHMNPMLPGACLIYRYKQHPSGRTVPFIPFPKHQCHMWVSIKWEYELKLVTCN